LPRFLQGFKYLKLADAIEVVFNGRCDASRITVSDNTGTATVKQNSPANGSIEISSVECGKENAVGGISRRPVEGC
jgi:hypothetical protein